MLEDVGHIVLNLQITDLIPASLANIDNDNRNLRIALSRIPQQAMRGLRLQRGAAHNDAIRSSRPLYGCLSRSLVQILPKKYNIWTDRVLRIAVPALWNRKRIVIIARIIEIQVAVGSHLKDLLLAISGVDPQIALIKLGIAALEHGLELVATEHASAVHALNLSQSAVQFDHVVQRKRGLQVQRVDVLSDESRAAALAFVGFPFRNEMVRCIGLGDLYLRLIAQRRSCPISPTMICGSCELLIFDGVVRVDPGRRSVIGNAALCRDASS